MRNRLADDAAGALAHPTMLAGEQVTMVVHHPVPSRLRPQPSASSQFITPEYIVLSAGTLNLSNTFRALDEHASTMPNLLEGSNSAEGAKKMPRARKSLSGTAKGRSSQSATRTSD